MGLLEEVKNENRIGHLKTLAQRVNTEYDVNISYSKYKLADIEKLRKELLKVVKKRSPVKGLSKKKISPPRKTPPKVPSPPKPRVSPPKELVISPPVEAPLKEAINVKNVFIKHLHTNVLKEILVELGLNESLTSPKRVVDMFKKHISIDVTPLSPVYSPLKEEQKYILPQTHFENPIEEYDSVAVQIQKDIYPYKFESVQAVTDYVHYYSREGARGNEDVYTGNISTFTEKYTIASFMWDATISLAYGTRLFSLIPYNSIVVPDKKEETGIILYSGRLNFVNPFELFPQELRHLVRKINSMHEAGICHGNLGYGTIAKIGEVYHFVGFNKSIIFPEGIYTVLRLVDYAILILNSNSRAFMDEILHILSGQWGPVEIAEIKQMLEISSTDVLVKELEYLPQKDQDIFQSMYNLKEYNEVGYRLLDNIVKHFPDYMLRSLGPLESSCRISDRSYIYEPLVTRELVKRYDGLVVQAPLLHRFDLRAPYPGFKIPSFPIKEYQEIPINKLTKTEQADREQKYPVARYVHRTTDIRKLADFLWTVTATKIAKDIAPPVADIDCLDGVGREGRYMWFGLIVSERYKALQYSIESFPAIVSRIGDLHDLGIVHRNLQYTDLTVRDGKIYISNYSEAFVYKGEVPPEMRLLDYKIFATQSIGADHRPHFTRALHDKFPSLFKGPAREVYHDPVSYANKRLQDYGLPRTDSISRAFDCISADAMPRYMVLSMLSSGSMDKICRCQDSNLWTMLEMKIKKSLFY